MPRLLIHNDYGNWYASIGNTPVSYIFAGADGEAQIVQVRALQEAMTQGTQAVIEGAPQFFRDVTGDDAEDVVVQLFGTTSNLYFEGTFVFEGAAESTLIEEIEEAGEALAAFV